ncbi:MAG: DUF3006 domain-containing protein [Pyrinomonadaceae bacterium]
MAETKDKDESEHSGQIHAVIDRIEDGGMAVIYLGDDKKVKIDLPASLLPEGASDGDHLRISISIDKQSRSMSADRIKKLQDQLAQQSGTQDQKDFKL